MLLLWLTNGWLPAGTLGLRRFAMRSSPKAELRLLTLASKCPDRFSRSDACILYPESLRETGVVGNVFESGEGMVGEGGDWVDEERRPRAVVAVEGRSLPRESLLNERKAFSTTFRL